MTDHQYAILCSVMVFLVMVIVVVYFLNKFFKSNFWKYINTPKQKAWIPDFLLKGEKLRVVRTPYSFPEKKIINLNFDYKHEIITTNNDVIIYWKKSDYCEAKRLYEDQIMAKS